MDAFWQAGIDAGYRDDGAPGPRTIYGPDYYVNKPYHVQMVGEKLQLLADR